MIFHPGLYCILAIAVGAWELGVGSSLRAAAPAQSIKAPQELLTERELYQAALRAEAEGLHEVAALKYTRLLKDKTLAKADADTVGERMVESLVRARQAERALAALTLLKVPDASYWRGQCHLLLHEYRDAETEFRLSLTEGSRRHDYARLSLGQALVGQGREIPGRKEFKELMESTNTDVARLATLYWNESEILAGRPTNVLRRLGPEKDDAETEFLKACSWLKAGDGKQAEILLRRILPTQNKDLDDAGTVRLAEAYETQGRNRTAERELLRFLDHGQESRYYEQAFALLIKVTTEEDSETLSRLKQWAAVDAPSGRHALALFYLGQWLGNHGEPQYAVGFLEAFVALHPGHPREPEALRSMMSLYGSLNMDERVLELANLWKARSGLGGQDIVDYLTAITRHARGEHGVAASLFEKSAALATDLTQSQRALYNAAVSALMGKDMLRYQKCLAQLESSVASEVGPDPTPAVTAAENPAARLMLERALQLAKGHEPEAESALEEFLKTHPAHPRSVEALVAVAELCLLDKPVRAKAAAEALLLASQMADLDDPWKERIDYTRLWLHEAAEDFDNVAEAGLHFLTTWTKSLRRDEVRMKVAQAFFRLEDYANAGIQFEQLVEEQAESPYAEVALFFAGKSAMALLTPEGLEKAISHWSEVVNLNGPLMREAQRQQALAKRRQGKDANALAVIETLITSEPPPVGEELFSLLIEKGELLVLLSREDPKQLELARDVFTFITQDSTASRAWRGQAGFLLAQCHLQAGRSAEALEACSDVVESCLNPKFSRSITPQEYVWLYRAGFAGLEVLKSKQEWEAAARLADRLASAGGDRSTAARQEATRIRLEHFLWEK